MDIEKFQTLLTILKCGSITATSEQLGYSPSGISRMMTALEKELGFSLLLRSRNGILPTSECEKLLPQIRKFVSCGNELWQSAAKISGIECGELCVGTPYPSYYAPLFRLISDFHTSYPKIEVQIFEGLSSDLCAAVERNEVDFSIVSRREGDFDWIPLRDDPLVALVAPDHPLASQKSIPLSALETEPFIIPQEDQETDCRNFLLKNSIHPKVHFTCRDTYASYYMVAAGLGITLDNAIFASRYSDVVCACELDPPQTISIGIATPHRESLSPAAKKFIAMSKQFF